jgi:hypothetical protein
MKKDKLIEYCKSKGIVVPPKPTLEYLHAAIVRAMLHGTSITRKSDECFGFWEYENSTCVTCDFEAKCFKASIGMDKEEYFKKLEALERPALRYEKRLSKSKKVKL